MKNLGHILVDVVRRMRPRTLKQTLFLFYAYSFLSEALLLGAVLVPFFQEFGSLNQFEIQLVQGFFMLTLVGSEIPTGVVADRFGRRTSFTAGVVVMAIALAIYPLQSSLWWFLFVELLIGIGSALRSGANTAWLKDTLIMHNVPDDHRQTQVFARSMTTRLIGISLGSIIGGVVATQYGVTAPVWLSAIPLMLAACIGIFLPEPPRKSGSHTKTYVSAPLGIMHHLVNDLKGGIFSVWKIKDLRKAALEATCINTVAYFSIWFYQPMLMDLGINTSWFGVIVTIMIVIEIVLTESYSLVERSQSRSFITKWTAVLVVAGCIGTATLWYLWTTHDWYYSGIAAVVSFMLFVGAVGLSRTGRMEQYMNTYIASDNRATVLSGVSLLMRLGIAVANPVIGLIYTLSPTASFLMLGCVASVAVLIRHRWPE